MAKNKQRGGQVEEQGVAQGEAQGEAQAVLVEVPVSNMRLTYRREHPGNRCSYGIAGNSGIVVFDKGLFAGSDQPGFTAPATITLDCEMVQPKADNKTAKAEAAAVKLAERAAKAQAKIEAAQAKAEGKRVAADEALAKARAKVEAAQAAASGAAGDGGGAATE